MIARLKGPDLDGRLTQEAREVRVRELERGAAILDQILAHAVSVAEGGHGEGTGLLRPDRPQ
jgi:hypothetical protein